MAVTRRFSDSTDPLTIRPSVCNAVREHYQANAAEYRRITERLHLVRGAFLAANRERQYELLKKAYVYATMTVNAPVWAANEAYGRWLTSDDYREAVTDTGAQINQKADHVEQTLDNWHDNADPVIGLIEDENYREAAEQARSFGFLGRVKSRFAIALLTGKTACLDTHTKSFVRGGNDRIKYPNAEDYNAVVDKVSAILPEKPRFVVQWTVFDFEREKTAREGGGDVANHDVFYDSLNIS